MNPSNTNFEVNLVQLYLPPYNNLNKDMLKGILNGSKSVFNLGEIRHINVPLYEELNVKKIFEHYKEEPLLKPYMPDKMAKGRQIDRTWFFNVFGTIFPQVLHEMIRNALSVRNDKSAEDEAKEKIEITEEFKNMLASINFKSSKFVSILT